MLPAPERCKGSGRVQWQLLPRNCAQPDATPGPQIPAATESASGSSAPIHANRNETGPTESSTTLDFPDAKIRDRCGGERASGHPENVVPSREGDLP